MFSKPLFKQTLKSSYKIILIFMAVLTMYFVILAGMYDPQQADKVQQMMKLMPKGWIDAMGYGSTPVPGLLGHLSTYFYGFLILFFPTIFDIILVNKLVSKHVDKGSMAYILATPNTRKKISVTFAGFILFSVTVLMAFVTILGLIYCQMNFSGMLDVKKFILINIGALLIHYAVSGIAFFASCVFNDMKNSLGIGVGIPIAFLIIQMLANMGGNLENFKYATMFTLFNPSKIAVGDSSTLPCFIALAVISGALFIGGIMIFNKKDLPI